jgi:DNA-binding FadR family transcriptional regulator
MINPPPEVAGYRQLAALIRAEITSGRLQPGQKLPSEASLQQQYGLARMTVRAAVRLLRAEGLAEHDRGHGVIVREPPRRELLTPPAGAVIAARMPTAEECIELDMPEGVPVFEVSTGGDVSLYPTDRWQMCWPG